MKSLNIVFENDQVLVVDKPAGLVVNRSETIKEETLQDQLAGYFGLSNGDLGIGDRAGIVHRLDRETSGLLLVAKVQKSFDFLQKQFAQRKVQKEYIALVHGEIKQDEGTITSAVGRIGKFGKFGVSDAGRESETAYELVKRYKFNEKKFAQIVGQGFIKPRINYLKKHAQDYTQLKVLPKTGRTHQIRVHLKSIGHPVVSDLIYTPAKLLKFDSVWCSRMFLHAAKLTFIDPATKSSVEFTSLLPKDLKNAMLNLIES